MICSQELLTTLALSGESESSAPLNSVRYRAGLQRLHRAFDESRPLVEFADSPTTDTSQLISHFLNGIDSDVVVVHIGKACTDPLEGMREVVRLTGFGTQGLSLVELEIMFMKFLSLQRFQHQRTIFLVEETPHNDSWVRDKVRNLVELETAGNFGLMVILSRPDSENNMIDEPAREVDSSREKNARWKKMRKLLPTAPVTSAPQLKNGKRPHELMANTENDNTLPLDIILTHQSECTHELTLEKPRLMVGRAEDNDLCINNTNVSRHHAILVRHGAAAVLMDMNSTNGTFVNSQRIKDHVVVHGDIIAIGNHHIRYIAPSALHSGDKD
jgi:hypothetical protein